MKHVTLCLSTVLLLAPAGIAAPSYSVPELVEMSLKRSDQIHSAQARTESMSFAAEQAGAWSNPEVAVELGQKRVPSDQGLLFGIEASQSIPLAGKRPLRREVARLGTELAQIEADRTQLDVVLNVVLLAYEYRSAREKVRFLENRNRRFELIRSYLSSHYFVSPQKRTEKELVESRLRSLTSDLFIHQGQYEGTYDELNLYVGFAETVPPEVSAPWFKGNRSLEEAEWIARVLAGNPSFAQQAFSVKVAEKEMRLATKDKWSDISLSAFYNEERAAETERFLGGGLSMALPVWNRNTATVQSRSGEIEARKYARRFSEQQLTTQVKRLMAETEAARRVISQYPETLLTDLEKRIVAMESEFRKGRIDLLTFLEAEAEFSETYERALESQAQYAAKIANLFTLAGDKNLSNRLTEF